MTEGTYEEELEETSEETLENICYMCLHEIEKYVIA